MHSAIRITTKVLTGDKIEVQLPPGSVGEEVEVFVILPEKKTLKQRSILEILEVPLRNENTILIDTYEQLLSSQVSLVPIRQTILKSAAQLRATTNLRTPDAIHAATALDANCTLFLTNDGGFRNVPNLAVVILNEVLAL